VSAIAGLQRFDILNLLKIINTTSVQLGGIAILFLTHNLETFIGWLVLNAIIFLVIHIWMCFRLLPGLSIAPRISKPVIKQIWKFSFDLNLISTLAVIYTQTDRVLISALLPLRMLGYYNAAYNISRQISTIQEFINTAVTPALAAKSEKEKLEVLTAFFIQYAQVLVYIVSLPAFILIFFGYEILYIWVGSEIAAGGALALPLLAIGFLINASMSTCYTLAIATGHSRIPVLVNIAGLGVYLPIMFYLLTNHALQGAALGSILLNLYYLTIFMPYTQWRILKSGITGWLMRVLLPFVIAGGVIFACGRLSLQLSPLHDRWLIVCLICTVGYTGVGFFVLAPQVRQQIIGLPCQILSKVAIKS
jgi:O-antigen/teichoic acid export membrane protein